jgi:hypothetical protein
MANLNKRVESMEKRSLSNDQIDAIFVRFVGAEQGKPGELPVLGWRFYDGSTSTNVMRNNGESDQELEDRAVFLARRRMTQGECVVRLVHIFE